MVRMTGVEPATHLRDQPLKLTCIPFHHMRIKFRVDLD